MQISRSHSFLRHAAIFILAHLGAAISAGAMLLVPMLIFADDLPSDVSGAGLIVNFVGVTLLFGAVIGVLTLPVTLPAYPLALYIMRRYGMAATIGTGAILGIGVGAYFACSAPENYPHLSWTDHRSLSMEVASAFVPAAIAAGIVFGWIVSSESQRAR